MKNTHSISLEEAMKHLSFLKLGEWLEYIRISDKQNFNKLLIMIQPMHLIYLNGIKADKIDSMKENTLRSRLIKKFLERGKVCLKSLLPEPSRL